MTQPNLPMDMQPVFDFSETDPWPLPAPFVWPARQPDPKPGAMATVGAALAGILMGVVTS